jgi:glyoxylase-like metal-dependent hydrolase (beta-lactamase superfamily II)
MQRHVFFLAVAVSCAAMAQDAKSVLEKSAKSLGASDLKSIEYTGTGATFTVGQNVSPTAPWPEVKFQSLTRTVDYANPGYRDDIVRAQRQSQIVSGQYAWNVAGANTTAAPATAPDRLAQVWLTPHGFLKAAMANNATAKSKKEGGKKVTVVSFTSGKYKYSGIIGEEGTVDRVDTWFDNPVLGAMLVQTDYSGYKDFGGVKFPTKIVQKQGGYPAFELAVTDVKPNVAVALTVPDAVRQATVPPVMVNSEKLADGVWYLTGGTHHSVLIEFKDYLTLIESPQNTERATAVLAEVKKLVPGKPLRYVVNTHHHFDHSGGLRTAAAANLTIVTHEINKPFYSKLFKGKIQTVGDKYLMTDGARSMELHLIKGSPHNTGILMAYLPREKMLVQADVFNPPPPNTPAPAVPNPASVNLYENIGRLNLDVVKIVPIHGGVIPLSELQKAIGKAS